MAAHRIVSTIAPGLIVATLLCSGCTSAPGTGSLASAASPSPSAGEPRSPSTSPSASPAATPAATPTITASAEPSTDPSSRPDGSPMAEPPAATLAVDGGDPVVGELGSFTWNNAGSDAPWLPGVPIHVGGKERLTFTMAGRAPIATWRVSRVLPAAVPGGDGAIAIAEGTGGRIAFDAPPAGSWSVAVLVRFGDNLGDAVYYWAMTVD